MTTFADLKNNRKSQFDKLTAAAESINSKSGGQDDDRFWKPTIDAAGNGSAIIRFLPAPAGEDLPFVRYWDHGFKGPGGWYIENSLTTLGQDDPVTQYNSRLWNEDGSEQAKRQARDQKRRLHYISNILVVSDPGNPSNDGKVFLYKYGKKIFDMINSAMHPEFADIKPVNPFDMWEGANFRLRARNVEGYRNYDKSTFDSPTAISKDDDELERIWSLTYQLQPFVDPKNFKTYAELQSRLNRVLGLNTNVGGGGDASAAVAPAWEPPTAESKPAAVSQKPAFDDDDDSLAFFQGLADK